MKKTILVLAVAIAALVMLTPGIALANYSIHGGYEMDTDECAGCHRAHTAPSSLTWEDLNGVDQSALLISTADEMYEFCETCHGVAADGAETNVVEGVYEGTVNGTTNDALLGGAFGAEDGLGGYVDFMGEAVTSSHYKFASWGAWGGGLDGINDTSTAEVGHGGLIEMSCTSCHDPHGSSNYRILKDSVYAGYEMGDETVGGYIGGIGSEDDPDPDPFVLSVEPGYPLIATGETHNGFRLHEEYPAYVPNYTDPMYARAPSNNEMKGMSGWCAGCHTQYNTWSADNISHESSDYAAADGYGLTERHRHPMNVPLTNFAGPRSVITTDALPLLHDPATEHTTQSKTTADWMDCMTCHVAHGTTATMSGYADVVDSTNPAPNSGTGGVDPTNDSALLRLDERGVCERCHNK